MKLKYYLRGVGIGLIIATLIMMISTALHSNKDISDEEIIARAEKLGMVMKTETKTEDKKTLADLDDPNKEETEDESSQEDVQEEQKNEESEDTSSDGKEEAENSQQNSTEDEQPRVEVIEKVEITVVPGEYSDKVSKKLQKAGLIDDAEHFNKYLAQKNYDNLIQPGNYEISTDSDYDEIIKIITEKK